MSYAITTNEELNEERLPLTRRLSPIGSASSDSEHDRSFNDNLALLEEQDRLNISLAALTRHVAHVQFRLQQVMSAPTSEDRENLLFELHEFATNGIPDVMCQTSKQTNERMIEAEKCREKEFIDELKHKLDELEHYAVASGSLEIVPTSVTMEKQRILIDQLRQKMDLPFDDSAVSKLSTDELRKLVDQAIYQLTNPVKSKENLIHQMRTEITDLEKFIEFLKVDSVKPSVSSNPFQSEHHSLNLSQSIKKFLVLTQLYALLLLSCGTKSLQQQSNQPTSRLSKDLISNKHFGDLRARLEIVIDKVCRLARTIPITTTDIITTSDTEEDDENLTATVLAIRQDLAPALRKLLEHGLHQGSSTRHASIWNCFLMKNDSTHIWQLFIKYYQLKKGYQFTESPAWKLSQSFSLDIIGGKPMTIKQCLLIGIDTIVRLHEKHTKQLDNCFKSFLCYALNEKQLVSFLRLILRTNSLVDNYYHPWSYTKQTGFNDALHSLDRLTSIDFHLPIDTSVRRHLSFRELTNFESEKRRIRMNEDFILGADPDEIKEFLHGLGLIPLNEYYTQVKGMLKRQGQSTKIIQVENGVSKEDYVKNIPLSYPRKRTSFSPVITRKRGKAIKKRTPSASQVLPIIHSSTVSSTENEQTDTINNDQPLDLRLRTKSDSRSS